MLKRTLTMISLLVPFLMSTLFLNKVLSVEFKMKENNLSSKLLTEMQGRLDEYDAVVKELRLALQHQESKFNTMINVMNEMQHIQTQKDETISKIQLDLDDMRSENKQLTNSYSICEQQIQSMMIAFNKLEKTNTNEEHVTSTINTKENEKNKKEEADGFAGLNTSVSMSLPEASGTIALSSTEYQRIEIGLKRAGKESVKRTVLGRHSGTDLVAFFVTLNQTADHLGVRQNVLFDNMVTNVGNGYNQHLGGFSAPVSGMYVLMSTLMSMYGHNDHFRLVRNGNTVCNMYVGGTGSGNHESSGGSYILHLNKGDVVAIQNMDSGEILFGFHYSYFSGFLLKAMEEDPPIVG
ncbi:uncharacterized protein LOC127855569 [Dreissena polymorpha]|uniref:C1q domain-containing protein n=1 Tax=Dreissena polymorpha TaxID=45954 RepID=A0A9D4HLM6_DREPO|nr:uncharacterized protein LOC127855569 [Dreissena polymorpha]KAH3721011.1 hypothetical protein DPMN_063923 [Dreissena polymorpha]